MNLCYYITAHGYGHGTRSCDIINALCQADPDMRILVKTDLPTAFLRSRLTDQVEIRSGAFDIGLIQKDALHIDFKASLDGIETLYANERQLIEQEAVFIREERINVVVADIPAIPLAAALQAGIPNIATSNFGWDWIYEPFVEHDPRWEVYVDKFRQAYNETGLLMRQPFAEPMTAFPNRVDLALLSSPGTFRREQLATRTGAGVDKLWALLAFTALDLEHDALEALEQLTDVEFFAMEPLAWGTGPVHSLFRSMNSFSDVLASVDVVVTKPGFGIVSECIANRKPMIYTYRADFREYDILVESIERFTRNAFISNESLYAGDLAPALEQLRQAPEPMEEMPVGGAQQAADIIREAAGFK